jgi:hypothetical protein
VRISRRHLAVLGLAATACAVAASPAAASTAGPASPASTAGTAVPAGHTPRLGSVGIRLMNAPVSERANPRARVYIIDHLAPGTTIRRLIQVSSTSRSPVRLSVYAAAASIAHGAFLFAPGRKQNLMTTWVHLSRPALRLGAGRRARERVTIRVPRNAPPGEQYGVIWAAGQGRDPAARNISLVNRVGIRIYLSVGPGGPPASNFTLTAPDTSRGTGGRALVTVQARNTGGRALDINGTLTLTSGPGGLRAGPFLLTTAATIAPGQSAPVAFTLAAGLPDGPWHALITLRSGLVTRAEHATISFATPPAAGTGFPVIPAAAASLLALTIIAAMIIRSSRPARRRA